MAITSYGYPVPGGVILPGLVWARMQNLLGRASAVPFADDWKPEANSGVARGVRMAPGMIGGGGILDMSDAAIPLQLPELSSGSQYFLLGGERKWGATNATVGKYIAGTSARAIPSFTDNPGTEQFHPVALARVSAGNPAITDLVDLRCIAQEAGVYTIFDDLALQLIARLGVTAYNRTTKITYRRVLGPTGPVWERVWDATVGDRPTIYAVCRTGAYRAGNSTERLGWVTAANQVTMAKTDDADAVFTYQAGQIGPAGVRFVTKVPGMYSLWGNMTISQNGTFSSMMLWGSAVHPPIGGLPGSLLVEDASVAASTAADYQLGDAVRKYALESLRYLKAGAIISLSAVHDNTVIIEDWQMWAQRVSD